MVSADWHVSRPWSFAWLCHARLGSGRFPPAANAALHDTRAAISTQRRWQTLTGVIPTPVIVEPCVAKLAAGFIATCVKFPYTPTGRPDQIRSKPGPLLLRIEVHTGPLPVVVKQAPDPVFPPIITTVSLDFKIFLLIRLFFFNIMTRPYDVLNFFILNDNKYRFISHRS